MYNNLSATKARAGLPQLFSFSHNREVHILSLPSGTTTSATARGVITSATWLDAGPMLGDILAVCTTASIELFSRSSPPELFHVVSPLDEIPATPLTTFARASARGSAVVLGDSGATPSVLIGTCTGVVHSFQLAPSATRSGAVAPTVAGSLRWQTPCSSVTCIAAAPGNRPVPFAGCFDCPGATWAVADDAGAVCVYGNPCTRVALLAACGSPCTGLAFHPSCAAIVASFGSGHVRIFSLDSNSVSVEIAAHARPVTALHIHPTLPLALTTSEDAWIRCWSLTASSVASPQPQQHPTTITVRQAFAASLPSPAMWTGAQFIDTAPTVSICVVAFDVASLYIFNQS